MITKKSILIAGLCLIALVSMSAPILPAAAISGNLPQRSASERPTVDKEQLQANLKDKAEANFDQIKQVTLNLISKAIAQLEKIEGRITGNKKLDDSTKQLLVKDIEQMEAQLVKYEQQLEGATTVDEVRQINQQVKTYIKDNKDVIKKTIQDLAAALGQEAWEAADALVKEVESLLKVWKVSCPSQKEAIAAVEAQVATLDKELDNLQSAIKAKNPTQVKQQITTVSKQTMDIVRAMEAIQTQCGQ